MGIIFTLDPEIKATIQDALDDLITELGKPCKLVYPSKSVKCVNCIYDPIGKKSSNIWKTGGPMKFMVGVCPMCNGGGTRAEEVSETIKMLCAWEPKKFFVPFQEINIKSPYGLLQTKFYLKDLPKIKMADHLVFQVPIEPYVKSNYYLIGEPGDQSNIIQDRYCIATWERR